MTSAVAVPASLRAAMTAAHGPAGAAWCDRLPELVAAPGSFYGPAGARHVRMALTASDERVEAAVRRLAG